MQRLDSIAYDAFHAHCYLVLGIVVLGINLWILFRIRFQMYTLVTSDHMFIDITKQLIDQHFINAL